MERKLVRIKEVSLFLGVHPQTLRRWERQGLIKPYRIGNLKHRRYDLRELTKLLGK